ncbi:MAG: hypothetical protein ACTHOU_10495 [Aureliella sp.]
MSRVKFSHLAKPGTWAWTLLLAVGLAFPLRGEPPTEQSPLVRLDNGQLALGLSQQSGGGIAWLSASDSSRNLVNAYDRGRLIQQSYYGRADGSLWNDKPWRWNPVQGGDWRGHPAKILELRSTATTAYVKTLPKHWASGQDLTTTTMEQWIDLAGPIAHIRYRFTQRGGDDHPAQHQELPAVFVAPELRWLVVYTGAAPWTGGPLDRSQPGWPNETRAMTEHWAAYVDNQDFGLGVYVPVADRLTCYRYGKTVDAPDACSYLAPLGEFAITSDFQWEYEVALSIGTAEQLRKRFAELAAKRREEGSR